MMFFFLLLSIGACSAQNQGQLIVFPSEDVTAPNITFRDFHCGLTHGLATVSADFEEEEVPIYYLNTTAERLASEGFQISINDLHIDAIRNFTAYNGTFSKTYAFDHLYAVAAVGGEIAKEHRAFYMAQLGFKNGDDISWLCDGVLLNQDWVLSAAHCFLSTAVPNLVRLGDFNLDIPPEQNNDIHGKFVYDFNMAEIVIHPEFELNERYHDLVLIRLHKEYPKHSNRINPICLPWGSLTNQNLVGKNVVLSGWGATHYGGPKTSILQEVELEVFPTPTCHRNYLSLPDFRDRYPNGMREENILCVGWETDGKDACGGDSGAPIVIDGPTITLAGIVSGGFGCGLSQFPGLYIPINKPNYLQWIKDVAFKKFS